MLRMRTHPSLIAALAVGLWAAPVHSQPAASACARICPYCAQSASFEKHIRDLGGTERALQKYKAALAGGRIMDVEEGELRVRYLECVLTGGSAGPGTSAPTAQPSRPDDSRSQGRPILDVNNCVAFEPSSPPQTISVPAERITFQQQLHRVTNRCSVPIHIAVATTQVAPAGVRGFVWTVGGNHDVAPGEMPGLRSIIGGHRYWWAACAAGDAACYSKLKAWWAMPRETRYVTGQEPLEYWNQVNR